MPFIFPLPSACNCCQVLPLYHQSVFYQAAASFPKIVLAVCSVCGVVVCNSPEPLDYVKNNFFPFRLVILGLGFVNIAQQLAT